MAKEPKTKLHPLGIAKIGAEVWKIMANRKKVGMVVKEGNMYLGRCSLSGIECKTWATSQGHLLTLLWGQYVEGEAARQAVHGRRLTLVEKDALRLAATLEFRARYKKNYTHIPKTAMPSKQSRRKARRWAEKNLATVKAGAWPI